jgi:hypothetical protein
MTEISAPKPPSRFDFHEVRAICQDVLDALAAQGLTASIDNLSGGCAGIRTMLPDGTAILISDLDGSLPADGQAACGWIAEHTAWQDGPTGYPGEPVTNVYTSTAPGDDTATMLAAVTACASAR